MGFGRNAAITAVLLFCSSAKTSLVRGILNYLCPFSFKVKDIERILTYTENVKGNTYLAIFCSEIARRNYGEQHKSLFI